MLAAAGVPDSHAERLLAAGGTAEALMRLSEDGAGLASSAEAIARKAGLPVGARLKLQMHARSVAPIMMRPPTRLPRVIGSESSASDHAAANTGWSA